MSLKTLCIILIGAQAFQSKSTTSTTCEGFDLDRQKNSNKKKKNEQQDNKRDNDSQTEKSCDYNIIKNKIEKRGEKGGKKIRVPRPELFCGSHHSLGFLNTFLCTTLKQ